VAADPRGPEAGEARAGARALLVSVWASAGFTALSLAWGLAVGSQMIVFDGLYSFASVGLSLLAVLALRTAGRGPDERYPWGREAWEPVAIVVKAGTLGGLCVYALVGAVAELLAGGREVSAGWAVLYAVLASGGGLAVSLYLRRAARGASDLVRAEAAEWLGDTLLSLGVLVGFGVALALQLAGRDDLARYVDPGLVAVISAAFLRVPARLLAEGFRELMGMAPPPPLHARLAEVVEQVGREHGVTETFLRTAKVGGRLDVEVDYVVGPGGPVRTVADCDALRAELQRRLPPLGLATSMSVNVTADRRWATWGPAGPAPAG
jgi:cation diffusion facilitator family transporter